MRGYYESQFEGCDVILGRAAPELGGGDDLVDLIGLNYYIHNQWSHLGSILVRSDPRYGHVCDLLRENYLRYNKPLILAETGIEDEIHPAWLRYICNEVFAAAAAGVPVQGSGCTRSSITQAVTTSASVKMGYSATLMPRDSGRATSR